MTLALLMLLSAVPASENADAEIDRAQQLYKAFKIADGIKVLGAALQRSTLPAKERGRVYVYVGLGEASRGNDTAAKRAFDQALAYDPDATLPELASPKTKALFAQALSALPPPPPKPKPLPPPEEPKPAETPKPIAEEKPVIIVDSGPPVVPSRWWLGPAVVGIVAAATGAVLIQQSESRYSQLTTGVGISMAQTNSLVSQGSALQTGSWVAFSLAAAATVTALLLWLLTG